MFTLLKAFAEENTQAILAQIEPNDGEGQPWTAARIEGLLDGYFADHERIRLDPEARATKHMRMSDEQPRRWNIEQTLVDPDELNDWVLKLAVDLDRSDAEDRPALVLEAVEAIA